VLSLDDQRLWAHQSARNVAHDKAQDPAGQASPTLSRLALSMAPQPNDTTCGPTCLQAVYRYYGDGANLHDLIDQVRPLPEGGTMAVTLANHALKRGYRARIYTYNVQLFDPTWFGREGTDLRRQLTEQLAFKNDVRLKHSTDRYLEYLELGGELLFGDHTSTLIRKYLKQGVPILTGLSATYLYPCAREYQDEYDSVRGDPQGHFVVLSGYDKESRKVMVADPLKHNPGFGVHYYAVDTERLVSAIMLGVVTYDANLLMLTPKAK
jgi:hypothetical protein